MEIPLEYAWRLAGKAIANEESFWLSEIGVSLNPNYAQDPQVFYLLFEGMSEAFSGFLSDWFTIVNLPDIRLLKLTTQKCFSGFCERHSKCSNERLALKIELGLFSILVAAAILTNVFLHPGPHSESLVFVYVPLAFQFAGVAAGFWLW